MNLKQPYTDNSILTNGKYKFVSLFRVPAEYLLNIYFKENKNGKYPDRELIAYIESNLEKLKQEKGLEKKVLPVERLCEKLVFPSKKDAKFALNQIKEEKQEHKKPVRTYECERCGGWHLTSISHEEWEKRKI